MLRKGIDGRNILALTFTNKAAGEMRERIAHLAPDSGVWVGTFHALCARLLRQYAPLVGLDRGFTIYDQSDRLRAVKSAMERMDLDGLSVTPERIDSAISRAKNDLVTPEMMAKRSGDHVQAVVSRVYKAYQQRLAESSAADFRRLARPHGRDPQGPQGRPPPPRRPVPLRDGRRISGYESRPVRHHPGALDRSPQPLRHRRPRPVDLRLARGESEQHPRIRAGLPRLQGREAGAELPQHPRISCEWPTI